MSARAIDDLGFQLRAALGMLNSDVPIPRSTCDAPTPHGPCRMPAGEAQSLCCFHSPEAVLRREQRNAERFIRGVWTQAQMESRRFTKFENVERLCGMADVLDLIASGEVTVSEPQPPQEEPAMADGQRRLTQITKVQATEGYEWAKTRWLRRQTYEGHLPSYKVGGLVLIDLNDLDAMVEAGARGGDE